MQMEEFFAQDFLGNSFERWMVAVGLFLGVLLVGLAVRSLVASRIEKVAARTDTPFDDLAASLLRNTHFLFFFLVALHVGANSLILGPKVAKILQITFFLVVFLQIGLWLSRAINFLGDFYVNRTLAVDAAKATTLRTLMVFSQLFLWVLIVLLMLDNWGVKVGPFIAGLGLGGIAIAFAVQGILADIFASLSIVMDKPFAIGDSIGVGAETGTVEYVGVKTTRVRSISGEQLVFSNADLLKMQIKNFKRMTERRVLMKIGVEYETALSKLESLPRWLQELVEAEKDLRFGRAHIVRFGDSSLDYELEYFVRTPDAIVYMDIQQKLHFAILRKFEAEEIGFAYPTRKVFFEGANPAAKA